MTNLSDSDLNLRTPGADAPGARPRIDRDFNLRPGPVVDGNQVVSPTWIVAIVVAVAVIGAIIYSVYGFTGTRTGNSPASSTVVAPTTDPATPATAPPKAK
jgi:hypothetical protein